MCPVDGCYKLPFDYRHHLDECLQTGSIAYCKRCEAVFSPEEMHEHELNSCKDPECDNISSRCMPCSSCSDFRPGWGRVREMFRYGARYTLLVETPLPSVLVDLAMEYLGALTSRKRKREEEEEEEEKEETDS
jgi:hypothetical protein